MSPYETASLFYQVADTAHAALANYLTVVFAVLVVSYFAARKLDRMAIGFLLFVYSMFCVGMIREIVGLYSDLARLGWAIAERSGDALDWHGMALGLDDGPPWEIPVAVGLMCALAFFGSLFFFFRLRRQALNEDATQGDSD